MLQFDNNIEPGAVIKVVGVGGAGNNAVNCMIDSGVQNVDFIAVNTDRQALGNNKAELTITIGDKLTRGLGAGSNPEIGQRACEESIDEIRANLENADMVFITAGMGGGTGTGASPIIAKAAKDMGILTIAVVTTPFQFEGKKKMRVAELGLSFLKQYVDALVVVPNEKLLQVSDATTTLINAFNMSNDVLKYGVSGIANIISEAGMVNVDFADVRTAMTDKGIAHMGVGHASGEDRAAIAVDMAINSPLLETKIDGAKAVLLYIEGGYDLGMYEISKISSTIQELVDEDCIFKFGAMVDPNKSDEITVTIIATGFDEEEKVEAPAFMAPKENSVERKVEESFVEIDGLHGVEKTLQDVLNEHQDENEPSMFDIPDFLK